jgi:hypothetical protein
MRGAWGVILSGAKNLDSLLIRQILRSSQDDALGMP